jgi:hypothetical protein
MTATEADTRGPGTEIDLHRPQQQPSAIPAKLAYARALAESGLLPAAYRKQPANILWAVEYGDMLGLSTMAAITGVHVIEGKPTASAGLISALVRRAGHKLRVHGDADAATCQIIRSDDQGYTFTVTFTAKDAQAAGLLGKDVWKKYRPSMLKARAITQCARDACEEALFGLHYTPEELGANVDEDGVVVENAPQQTAERSGGTPEDDQWYVRPEPAPASGTPENGQRWAEGAIVLAASFKSEAEGTRLWKEAAARRLKGECTTDEQDHIQHLVEARIQDRRKEASERLLLHLSEDDDWRDQVRGLTSDDEAREAVEELGRLKGAGTMDETRAGRIAAAIIARYPKAALKDDAP